MKVKKEQFCMTNQQENGYQNHNKLSASTCYNGFVKKNPAGINEYLQIQSVKM